jgi:hypothetical protein
VSAAALYRSFLFDPLRPWLAQLPPAPDGAALAALLDQQPCFNERGQRLSFVDTPDDGLGYECRIWQTGAVATRPDNWHDFFNALVWLAFTETKRAINLSHMQAMLPEAEGKAQGRGNVRDALTHFDECGIVVLSSQPELLELLRNFQWKTLFVERRSEVVRSMRFLIVGHATYEQLLQPFRGLTAKAVLYTVTDELLAAPLVEQVRLIDARLAVDLVSGRYTRPRDFQPLPLLGIPGVTPDNEAPAYYDDTWQFRPGRRRPETKREAETQAA